MRENFDYVTMDTYKADMAELAAQSAAIIEGYKQLNAHGRRVLAELILAAGGSLKVSERVFADPRRDIEIEVYRHAHDLTMEWRARLRS